MGKGKRIREQRKIKATENTLDLSKTSTLEMLGNIRDTKQQELVTLIVAKYIKDHFDVSHTPYGGYNIELSYDTRRDDMDNLLDALQSAGISEVTFSYPNVSGNNFCIEVESVSEDYIDDINDSVPKADIIISEDKLSELNNKYGFTPKYDGYDMVTRLSYDDLIFASSNWDFKIRVIVNIESTKNEIQYMKQHNETWSRMIVGYIIIYDNMVSEDPDEWDVAMPIHIYESFRTRKQRYYQFIASEDDGIFSISDKFEVRRKFRHNMIQFGSDRYTITSFNQMLLMWENIAKALNDPEIKEIWETKEIKISNDPSIKRYSSNKKPLENIKRIYMCEHQSTGREIERHTDKWYVRGHEVHRKNGKVFFRKGYYKGPGRDDKDTKPEPRKRVINTFGNTLDKEDLDEFYNLIK